MKYISKKESTLLEVLGEMFPDSSKSTLRAGLKEERVSVNGVTEKNSRAVVPEGAEVSLGHRKKFLPYGIKVIYDDDSLVVIQKPAGLLSVSTDFESEFTAFSALKKYYAHKNVQVVHRLDRDTSGLMIFALNKKAYDFFKIKFELHDVERQYCAIVEGIPVSEKGTWESYLYEDGNYVVHSTHNTELGKQAVTHYQVLGSTKYFAWMDFRLETGRKNQIRAQARDSGHPLVGDEKYGAKTKTKRLYLHAYRLTFEHPETKKRMIFSAPIPESFYKLVKPRIDPLFVGKK